MQTASDSVVEMASNAGNGTIQITNMTKASKAAELGLKALSTVGNMLIMWAAIEGIKLLVKWLDESILTYEEAKEKLSETESELDSVNQQIEELNTQIKELEDIETVE